MEKEWTKIFVEKSIEYKVWIDKVKHTVYTNSQKINKNNQINRKLKLWNKEKMQINKKYVCGNGNIQIK